MKPARFDFHRPTTLEEALLLLSRYGSDARLIAGGQSLVPMMNLRIAKPDVLIDLGCIPALAGIDVNSTNVRIGAMTRQCVLLTDDGVKRHIPLLTSAASHVGHFQTRSRGTVGGSLAHADPSAEISLVMVTLDAKFKLQNAQGERFVAAREFFVDALTTVVAEDEILTEVIVPANPPGSIFAFREFARRHGDFAIASVAVQRSSAGKPVSVGLGAIGAVPHFCSGLSAMLSTNGFDPNSVHDLIAREVDRIQPIGDLSASSDYRRHLAATLLDECLREAFQ